jgi:rhamnosyltransferase
MLRLAHVPKILALREVLINVVHQAMLILTQQNKALQLKYFLRGVRDGFAPIDRA